MQDNLAWAIAAGLTWPLGLEVTVAVIEERLFNRAGLKQGMRRMLRPDWDCIIREMTGLGSTSL